MKCRNIYARFEDERHSKAGLSHQAISLALAEWAASRRKTRDAATGSQDNYEMRLSFYGRTIVEDKRLLVVRYSLNNEAFALGGGFQTSIFGEESDSIWLEASS